MRPALILWRYQRGGRLSTATLLACAVATNWCATSRAAQARQLPTWARCNGDVAAVRRGLLRLRGGRAGAADDEEVLCGGHGIEERSGDGFEVSVGWCCDERAARRAPPTGPGASSRPHCLSARCCAAPWCLCVHAHLACACCVS